MYPAYTIVATTYRIKRVTIYPLFHISIYSLLYTKDQLKAIRYLIKVIEKTYANIKRYHA